MTKKSLTVFLRRVTTQNNHPLDYYPTQSKLNLTTIKKPFLKPID
jgi:hypothetical protein